MAYHDRDPAIPAVGCFRSRKNTGANTWHEASTQRHGVLADVMPMNAAIYNATLGEPITAPHRSRAASFNVGKLHAQH